MASKQSQFDDLIRQVQDCSLCPRMSQRKKLLGSSNGNLDSAVVFIAEAPGRLGADKFGIPLYGDQTGQNFQTLLDAGRFNRESVFITNAVLCNPRTPDGNNDSPRLSEIHNCSQYLKQTLDIIKPKYIVTLGAIALASLNNIEPHGIRLSEGVGEFLPWSGYLLYPLFHPGPRAFIWRSKAQQIKDYKRLGDLLENAEYDT